MQAISSTLSGVTFNDGGTASGSFDYDLDTDTLSSIFVTTTAGPRLPGATYGFESSYQPATDDHWVIVDSSASDLTGMSVLVLATATPVTNLGGTATLTALTEGICQDSESNTASPFRFFTAGRLDSSVPSPTILALLDLSLVGIGYRQSRQWKTV